MFVAATSVVAAIFLTSIKIVIGIWTGSLGILAEAAHSALDLVAAVITFFAVRVSDKPADESHLYGHGKIENLSALAETGLLLLTCVWIVYESVRRLFFVKVEIDPSLWAFLTMGISIVIDFSRSKALARIAKKYHSQALEADALHFSTDIWSSAVVIVGLALVWLGKLRGGDNPIFERADAGAALIVAFIVIYVSIKLGRKAVDTLLDRAPQGLADRLIAAVSLIVDVRRVSRIRLRSVGNQLFVDLNLEVPRSLSFEESHAVTRNVEETVRKISPNADVVVHSEPVAEREGILEKIQAVAALERLAIHNVTTHWTERGIWIDLDLEVRPDLTFQSAHSLATDFETRIKEALSNGHAAAPLAEVTVHIEPRPEELVVGQEIDPAVAAQYIEKVSAIGREFLHAGGCRDIQLHEMKNGLYLSLCFLIEADLTIGEVHSIAEQMETRLRLEIPQLGRVVIHTEPA